VGSVDRVLRVHWLRFDLHSLRGSSQAATGRADWHYRLAGHLHAALPSRVSGNYRHGPLSGNQYQDGDCFGIQRSGSGRRQSVVADFIGPDFDRGLGGNDERIADYLSEPGPRLSGNGARSLVAPIDLWRSAREVPHATRVDDVYRSGDLCGGSVYAD